MIQGSFRTSYHHFPRISRELHAPILWKRGNEKMKSALCQFRLLGLTVSLFVSTALFVQPAFAQSGDNDGCSNASLTGDYAFRVSGVILPPVAPGTPQIQILRDGVAMTNFDGSGKLSQVDFVMSNGVPLLGPTDPLTGFHIAETGSYQVFPDCTGNAQIQMPTPPGGSSGAVISLKFVLANHGKIIHTVVSALIPPNSTTPIPASIHSDGEKLGE
jgi:hypothetical protein